ncbi:unnamed protein product [Prunus armeniaca]|uniref:Uncharacterized protein n=1 Tax=Prunus armeniaca TaxID=36596 RepID=A0A6J5TZV6_PRUAR|nr:unnamed protein product [Prunus armeniaca]
MKPSNNNNAAKVTKPPFVPAKDDTKPVLQDPILRSDPTETEEAALRLPTLPINSSKNPQPQNDLRCWRMNDEV